MAYYQNQYRARSAHFPRPQARVAQSAGPRIFPARFDSVCPTCQQPIVADETLIAWTPGQKAVHAECPVVAPVAPVVPVLAEGERLYTCTKRGCRNQGILWVSATPAASRLATGRPILCPVCGDCAVLKPASTIVPAAAAEAPVAEIVRLEVEDAGVYRLADGTIVKVQANKEKTRVYAKRLVEIGGERLTEAGAHVHAEYRYEAGLIAQVEREGVKLTLEEAKALTIRYGFCIRCGRHLKAAQSVEQGMGPVCITYFS